MYHFIIKTFTVFGLSCLQPPRHPLLSLSLWSRSSVHRLLESSTLPLAAPAPSPSSPPFMTVAALTRSLLLKSILAFSLSGSSTTLPVLPEKYFPPGLKSSTSRYSMSSSFVPASFFFFLSSLRRAKRRVKRVAKGGDVYDVGMVLATRKRQRRASLSTYGRRCSCGTVASQCFVATLLVTSHLSSSALSIFFWRSAACCSRMCWEMMSFLWNLSSGSCDERVYDVRTV